jgi:heat shock protein HtpX
MTLYSQQDRNVAKTWILVAGFLSVVIGIGWFFSYLYNNQVILYAAVLFSLVMNFVSYWYSDKIALAINGARPATREEFFDLYTVTENLAITAGLPMPKIYIIPDPAPNAFATGRNKEHAVVAVTTGLLQILDKTELEGVIAHELAHVGNRDILLSSMVVVLVGFISILSNIFLRTRWGGGSRDNDSRGGAILMVIGIVLAVLSPVVATLIQLAISRRREYLADASGALLTRYPAGLAAALEKIKNSAAPMIRANNATAHLFIESPFGDGARKGLATLFMTHPPIDERIKILREIE